MRSNNDDDQSNESTVERGNFDSFLEENMIILALVLQFDPKE